MSACSELSNAIPLLAGLLSPFVVIYVFLFVRMSRKLARLSVTAGHDSELVDFYRAEHRELLETYPK